MYKGPGTVQSFMRHDLGVTNSPNTLLYSITTTIIMRFSILTLVTLPLASSALAVTSLNERTPLMGARYGPNALCSFSPRLRLALAGSGMFLSLTLLSRQ
jgi:hypothetical protein